MVNTLWIVLLGITVIFVALGTLLPVMIFLDKLIRPHKKERGNPTIGACGISDFPISSRVMQKAGPVVSPYNHLLMHTAKANITG